MRFVKYKMRFEKVEKIIILANMIKEYSELVEYTKNEYMEDLGKIIKIFKDNLMNDYPITMDYFLYKMIFNNLESIKRNNPNFIDVIDYIKDRISKNINYEEG